MLVLSRKHGEELIVHDTETGETLRIMAVDIRPGKVRIGIKASQRFKVLRAEIDTAKAVTPEADTASQLKELANGKR